MFNHNRSLTKIVATALLIAGCSTTTIFSQSKKTTATEKKDPQRFFSKPDLMQIGVYYYPEQWPREQWERDLKNIKKLGFEFTHFAEFAWTYMEPEEGKYDFKWLDDALAIAEKEGLKVILCTPTPTPPAWMGEKYPEIYLVDASGRRREHGNRANHWHRYVHKHDASDAIEARLPYQTATGNSQQYAFFRDLECILNCPLLHSHD
jgi:beta-galactosidase